MPCWLLRLCQGLPWCGGPFPSILRVQVLCSARGDLVGSMPPGFSLCSWLTEHKQTKQMQTLKELDLEKTTQVHQRLCFYTKPTQMILLMGLTRW